MELEKVMKHFATNATGLAKILGVGKAAVSLWKRDGIPELRQIQIEEMTNRKFKAPRPWA